MPGSKLGVLAVAGMVVLAVACSEERVPSGTTSTGSTPPSKPSSEQPEDLVSKGRQAYLSNCIACHNPDPKVDGALGPAVAGASEDLLTARVLYGEYPEGYTPMRDTRSMVPMPFLERQIPALAAYLETLSN